MPPRVTYWTGVWSPRQEALSKEVETLRAALSPGSPVVSFSQGNRRSRIDLAGRAVALSARRWLLLRALARVVEPRGDVTHVVGGMSAWHLLRSVGRRPIIFTVAIPGPALPADLLAKVTVFAAETEPLADSILAAGVARERIRVISPGVDLEAFRPRELPPKRPFRILFASTPSDPAEIEPRGIPLLVEAARRLPDVEVLLLWRPWGDPGASRRAIDALRAPANVRIEVGRVADMPAALARAHAVAYLVAPGAGKSCPNSAIEALACGRPVVVADSCDLAGPVEDARAGAVAPRSVQGVVAAVDAVRSRLADAALAARRLAERMFDGRRFVADYRALYAAVLGRAPEPAARLASSLPGSRP